MRVLPCFALACSVLLPVQAAPVCTAEVLASPAVTAALMERRKGIAEHHGNTLYDIQLELDALPEPMKSRLYGIQYREALRRHQHDMAYVEAYTVWEHGCSANELERARQLTNAYSPDGASLAREVESYDAIRPDVREWVNREFNSQARQ